MHKRLLTLLLLLVVGDSSAASIYRWVDENGVTHFSETPPVTRKAEAIDSAASPSTSGQTPRPAAKTWQEKEVEFQKRQIERREQERNQQAEEEKAKARRMRCVALKHDLALAERSSATYSLDESGKRLYWSEEKRAAQREALRKEVAATCDGQ
ncbi:DUF4124 domain-containing protein [Accumulibacter sp.]|uniref:DUF4124 domain-containing protein n=1 Tax=Accumulibacter sp. TaxID=2053492 RepID=UPI0025D978C8|nr:DUF4124 domain-containing protein [Accumulibacter sp.]MCM8596977.1 DUF4124 domain-containing protein [Accumulibacter sp.]MCM8624471.1 DUF4124 domain-containing protein [Accumulibacter sp.]MDS4051126.1 DUF4124 domain-containing protein [Accumulibacter sp.]